MFFAAPIWLFGLIPCGIAAVVLLMSRRPRTDVPFLDLWKLNAPQEAIRRSFSTPPIGVVLALLAALLAILSAAGPSFRRPGLGVITVVVDAGAGLSSRSAVPNDRSALVPPRFVDAGERLAAVLDHNAAESIAIDLVVVPGVLGRPESESPPQRIDASGLRSRIAQIAPTAVATGPTLDRIVTRRLTDPDARVVVLSDRLTAVAGDTAAARVVVVPPMRPMADNLGIMRLAVRRTPATQAMVRVERSGKAASPSSRRATLRLTSAGQTTEQTFDLASDSAKDLFVNLPTVGGVVTAELADGPVLAGGLGAAGYADAFSADDRADLIVESDWPVIEPAVSVGELERLIDLYTRSRPAGDRSVHVRLVPSATSLGASAGIILPAVAGLSRPTRSTHSTDHMALGGADLTTIDVPAAIDRTLPSGKWQVILSDGLGPLVAVREGSDPLSASHVRQAWCAVDPRGWAHQVAYVVFWSALMDWVGSADGGDQLIAYPLETLTPDWTPVELAPGIAAARFWPGVYQRSDGVRRAFGPAQIAASPVPPVPAVSPDADVARLLRDGSRAMPLSPWLSMIAIALAAAAAVVWRRKAKSALANSHTA